ncbi:MAG: hypothetical protein RL685_431 [Pseudomonadota bacterium]|jgi:putative ABC transport system permease protein
MSLDTWQEVSEVLRRNKLRALLTATSVAWGIFLLVTLIAAGNGLRSAVQWSFRDEATNSILLRRGRTSLPHEGHSPGRPINFAEPDLEALRRHLPDVEYLSGRSFRRASAVVSRGNQTAAFEVRACQPDHQYLERTIVTAGRFINELDEDERRKVAVIGSTVRRVLFGDEHPLGKWINVSGVNYEVVGVFDDVGGDGELRIIYVPLSTAQLVYQRGNELREILFSTGATSAADSEAAVRASRQLMAARHHFDPADRRALQVSNNLLRFRRVMDVFDWVRTFVWVAGVGTLFAGIVGVSNIMIISVQERTLEIGIRKALGATPGTIISMILLEALVLTSLAGYVGLVGGVGIVEALRRHLPDNDYLRNPTVDVRVALLATLLLIVAGALAGLLPALAAARVRPVVVMRSAAP